jgi:ribose transport system permease protein
MSATTRTESTHSNQNPIPGAPKKGRQRTALLRALKFIRQWGPLFVLILLLVIFSSIEPRVASLENLVTILSRSAVPMVLAVGMTYIIILGGIDLSVPGTMALGSLVIALLVLNNRNGLDLSYLGILVGLCCGGLAGFINGFAHTRFKIPSFMVTLGMYSITYGVAMLLSGGAPPKVLDEGIRQWGIGQWFGISRLAYLAIVVVIAGWIVQRFTRLGRYAYVIGGGEEIAKQSGINVNKYKIIFFTLAGMLFSLGGMMETSRIGIGHTLIGPDQDFATITAVVLGGTLLSGGVGGILNSILGVLIIQVLSNGLIFIGANPYIHKAIQGGIILIAVIATNLHQRNRMRVVK